MEYKISDIATVIMGGTPSTANPNYWNGNVLWVTPKDLSLLNGGKYIYTTLSTLTFEGLAHSSAKLLPPNSIILSTRAPVGYLAISAYEMSTNQGIKALIPNNAKVDTEYLYYLLTTQVKNLEAKASGSTFKELSTETLKDFILDLPTLDIQHSITNILGSIDKKIEINKKKIEKLEDIAHTIYLHKFFQKTPNGNIGNIIIEEQKSNIQVGDSKKINGIYPFFTSGDSILTWSIPLISGRHCFLNTGGNADVKFYVGEAAYSTDTWCVYAKNNLTDYLYLVLDAIRLELDKKFFCGTGLKHLQKDLLKTRPIYIPTEMEIQEFNKLICPILTNRSHCSIELNFLIKFRNYLLPLLMNGQVNVK